LSTRKGRQEDDWPPEHPPLPSFNPEDVLQSWDPEEERDRKEAAAAAIDTMSDTTFSVEGDWDRAL